MVNFRSGVSYIITLMYIISKVRFVFILFCFCFGVTFYFLFGCRFLLIKGTEKTEIYMKTCGLNYLMRPCVTG